MSATSNLKGLTIEIGGNTSKLSTALKSVNSEISNLQANLRTVNAALKLDPGNIDALTQKQKLLTDAVDSTREKLETLKEAQRQADEAMASGAEVDQTAYRNLQSEIVRTEASLNDYGRQLTEVGNQLEGINDDTRELGDVTEQAGDQAENAAQDWTIVKEVISDLASEAIRAAVDAFKELAFESEASLDRMQARIGASSAEMEKYGQVAQNVFNNAFGDSLDEVTDAIATVTQMMGEMNEQDLQNVTENVMTLSDVFGWDVRESVLAVNSLMNQFGITADEAFNLLVQGAQRGLDQNNDLLDTINEYSVQFSNAGYSADEMFNMLLNGAQEGTWSIDKLGDAVKEYNIRMTDGTVAEAIQKNAEALGLSADQAFAYGQEITEGGEAGKIAMGKVLEAILAIENPTLRYQMGVQAFGTMWEDLGETAVAALFQTEGAIESTNTAMSQVKTDAYDNLMTSVTSLGRTLKSELFNTLVNNVGPALTNIVNTLTANVKPAIEWVTNNLPTVGALIGAIFASIVAFKWASVVSSITNVGKAVSGLFTMLAANPIGLVVTAIGALVTAFVYAYNNCESFRNGVNNAMKAIWNTIKPVVESIKNAFVQAWEAIKVVWDKVAPFFTTIWNTIKANVEPLKNQIANVFQTAWTIIKNVWNAATGYFKAIWDTIAGIFSVVKSVLSGDFKGAWDAIKGIVSTWAGYFQNTWNSIKNIFGAVVDFFRNTFSNAWTAVKNVFSGWGSFFSGLWDSIKNTFSALGTKISDAIGGSVKAGINGIISAIQGIVNKGVGLVNGAIDLINLIPGVSIGKIGKLQLPRLAKGGVVKSPTLAEIGEYAGARTNPEIVAPQSIIRETLADALEDAFDGSRVFGGAYQSTVAKLSPNDLKALLAPTEALFKLIKMYLPEIATKTGKDIYLDKRRLVGGLIDEIDERLGEISARKAVDAV